MWIWFILGLLFSTQILAANEKFITRIHSISWGTKTEAHLLKFHNARVAFIYDLNKSLPLKSGELVEVEVSPEHRLISLVKVEDNEIPVSVNDPFITDIDYQPTLLSGYQEALSIFKDLRSGILPGSLCYERAHVWAFEEYQRRGLHSMKAFVFFSDNYIRKYTFKWWFHVAPFVTYYKSGVKRERILDRAFATHPVSLKQWTDKFMLNKKSCKVIDKYSSYAGNKTADDCFVMKTNMYYWKPQDLEASEMTGVEKVNFFEWEVAASFQNAFGIAYQ